MYTISENEIQKRLEFDNPWWEENHGIEKRFDSMPRRFYYDSFFDLVDDKSINRAVILMGPRRVGKTVMVYHAIQNLIDRKVDPGNILYLSIETPLYTGLSLEKIVTLFKEQFSHKRDDDLYIFFDEIQYLKDWEIHLKSLVDSYPSYKFTVTGSAAAALRLKSRESGAGRFTEFRLPPLTFAEYLFFIGKEEDLFPGSGADVQVSSDFPSCNDIEALNHEFINYLNYGGYPEAVFSDRIKSHSARYIKSDIIDKVLLRDLPSLYGISDIQELNRLFTTVAYNTGNEVTLEALSKSSGVAKNTLKKYLEYLEAAFLIKRVNRVDRNARHFKRAVSFKVYLTNPSMRAALFGYIDEDSEAMGALTETAIFSQWLHSNIIDELYYARWKTGEVDIVYIDKSTQKPRWIVEVKWSDRVYGDFKYAKHVVGFIKKNKMQPDAVITTKTRSGDAVYDDVRLTFTPSSLYSYVVGKNSTSQQ